MRRRAFPLVFLVAVVAVLSVSPPVAACSPPFGQPTIAALGPDQVVIVGTTGERVAGGRLFHVERWFNGDAAVTPIVIAFKEGEPIGDCSYPMSAGIRLIIAPYMDGGQLSADLLTLQADPASAEGQRYLAEAQQLFGAGVVPNRVEPSLAEPTGPVAAERSPAPSAVETVPAIIGVVLALLGAVAVVAVARRRSIA